MDNNKRFTICFCFGCFVIFSIALLIHINSINYDSKIKSINRYEYMIKLPDNRKISFKIDEKENE